MTITKFLLTLSICFTFFYNCLAHQSIAYPTSISFERACRIGRGTFCPGPCPQYSFRRDVTPDNPQVSVRRGGTLGVKTFKNNHVGGFVRWSLVKVKNMRKHSEHKKFAFFYSCADQRLTKCDRKNKKDFCPGDQKNEYYQHKLRIPSIYDDGVYVLGFSWYGGLTKQMAYGFFGDYYDCTYIRIKGGPIKGSHQVSFDQGRSLTGKGGQCKATINRLGPCRVSPCYGNDGHPLRYRLGRFMKPAEFDKRKPSGLKRDAFRRS